MKYLCLILFSLALNFCAAQGVRFQLYRSTPCKVATSPDSDYYIKKISGNSDSTYLGMFGTAYLPGPGKYQVKFSYDPFDIAMPVIDIKDTGLYIYRYKEPKIGLYPAGMHVPSAYRSCGKLINGYDEDFYANGNIRIRGDFKNGRPVDSLVTFYENGKPLKRLLLLPDEAYTEEYDSLAHLVKVSHRKNKYKLKYGYQNEDSKSVEFFADGKIKLAEVHSAGHIMLEEFYPNGQLKVKQTKRRRIEYFDNGTVNISYRWTRKLQKESARVYSYDFTIHKKEYDQSGQIQQQSIYEAWFHDGIQPDLDFYKSDWVVRLIKYNNGKEISRITDINTHKLPD